VRLAKASACRARAWNSARFSSTSFCWWDRAALPDETDALQVLLDDIAELGDDRGMNFPPGCQ